HFTGGLERADRAPRRRESASVCQLRLQLPFELYINIAKVISMSKILSILTGTLMCAIMLFSVKTHAETEFFNHSGNQCRSFKAGPDFTNLYFSDAGISNDDTTTEYVIVCPLDWSGGTADATNPRSSVTVEYRDNNSTKAVSCSWEMANVLGALFFGDNR